jgi:hypothetical protein
LAPLSCDFEADRANEGIEIIDDTLIEAIELRSLLLIDLAICADWAEKAGAVFVYVHAISHKAPP